MKVENILNYEDVKELVSKEEYQVTKFYGFGNNKSTKKDRSGLEWCAEGENDFFGDNFVDGLPPTYEVYINAFMNHVLELYRKRNKKEPTEGQLHALYTRGNNLYVSKMSEWSLDVQKMELPNNMILFSSPLLDRVLGVDFVLYVKGKGFLYLHCFSNTERAFEKYEEKKKYRNGKAINLHGREVEYFYRENSEYHIALPYRKWETVHNEHFDRYSELIGTIGIYTPNTLERIIDIASDDDCLDLHENGLLEDTEIGRFIIWCHENDVDIVSDIGVKVGREVFGGLK